MLMWLVLTSVVMGRKGRTRETSALWASFGQWIKRKREEAGLKQTELAQTIGLHPVQLSRIENGATGTTRETVIALAHGLTLDMREAFNRAGFDLPSIHQSLNAIEKKLLDFLNAMPHAQQLDLLAMAELLWRRHGEPDELTEKVENVKPFKL